MRRYGITGAVIITMLLGAWPGLPRKQALVIPRDSRASVPNLTLSDSNGAPFKLSEYRGKVLLLDFWATWCDVCKTTIPQYIQLQKKFRSSGLSVVGIALDDDGWKSVTPFAKLMRINYQIAIGNWAQINTQFNFKGLPVALLVDRRGHIADMHMGREDEGTLENKIRALLQEGNGTSKSVN